MSPDSVDQLNVDQGSGRLAKVGRALVILLVALAGDAVANELIGV